MILKKYFQYLFEQAVIYNHKNIKALLENNKKAVYVDLGCDDGKLTIDFAKIINPKVIIGVDAVYAQIKKAKKMGIDGKKFDLNRPFPLSNNSIDVITANQVIEHLSDSDLFLKEIYRILKHGGYAILSTENASSWCNIAASLVGWQIFSLTNFSSLSRGIGNPLAIHRDEFDKKRTWQHVRIYNIYGLKEYIQIAGFSVEKILGSGYYPFPTSLGNIDKIHSHFITYKIRKS